MASRFVANPTGVQRELARIVQPVMRAFGDDIERRARANLAAARIGDRGTLARSIKVGFGPSGLDLIVSARRTNKGQDVAQTIHEGHRAIHKSPGFMKFKPKGTRRGFAVFTHDVRAVGGVPFLADALRAANAALPSDRRFVITIHSTPVRAPKPHEIPYRGVRR